MMVWSTVVRAATHRATVLAALWLVSLCAAHAEDTPALVLIVSQPGDAAAKSFVDLAPYIVRNLQSTSSLRTVVFGSNTPEVTAALASGKLTEADLKPPLTPDSARKVAGAISASRVLRVTASQTKQGISASATLESARPAGWKPVFEYSPSAPIAVKGSLLKVIYDHAAAIAKGVLDPKSPGSASLPPAPAVPVPTTAPPAPTRDREPVKPAPPAPAPVPGSDQAPSVAATPPAPAAATMPVDPNAALNAALSRYRERNDDANVIVTLRRAVNARPRDPSLRRRLAEAYRQRGMHEAARDEAVRAAALAPDDAGLRRLLGDGLMDGGDAEAAIREYQRAVQLGPTDAANHVALGDAYWNSSKGDEALKCYSEGAKVSATDPLPHRRLARVHLLRGMLADCLAEMKLAHKLTPSEDLPAYRSDYIALLQLLETSLQDGLAALQNGRKEFVAGTRTREQVFQEASDTRKRAQDTVNLLSELPSVEGFDGVQGQYGQAASLAAQAADSFMVYLETQNELSDQQATLMRLEANRQLNTAVERLKTLTAPRKPARRAS